MRPFIRGGGGVEDRARAGAELIVLLSETSREGDKSLADDLFSWGAIIGGCFRFKGSFGRIGKDLWWGITHVKPAGYLWRIV